MILVFPFVESGVSMAIDAPIHVAADDRASGHAGGAGEEEEEGEHLLFRFQHLVERHHSILERLHLAFDFSPRQSTATYPHSDLNIQPHMLTAILDHFFRESLHVRPSMKNRPRDVMKAHPGPVEFVPTYLHINLSALATAFRSRSQTQ
jgi:hypothetical protein